MKKDDQLLLVLADEIAAMDKAVTNLEFSYSSCQKIPLTHKYTQDEEEKFEALTSRFARLSDILLQKVWRSLFIAELEEDGTARDRINKAEKKALINNAEEFIIIRLLRNRIAHDYHPEVIVDVYNQVLHYTPMLLEAAQNVHTYVTHKHLI